MRMTVFGATGQVGRHVLVQALEAGHDVTAVVRDPARLAVDVDDADLEVVTADLTSAAPLVPALKGRDAVLSAIGPHSRRAAAARPATGATRAILAAMAEADVRRIVVVSAAPVGPPAPGDGTVTRLIAFPLLQALLRPVYDDLADMEAELRASAAGWTSFRPPRLTDHPAAGAYRTAIGRNVARGTTIPRADLAHAMLAAVTDDATVGQVVGIAR